MKVKNTGIYKIFPKICTTEKFKFFKVCLFMHSILGQGSFSTNSSISEVWHGSDQSGAVLRYYWAFSTSVLFDRLFLIFLLTISHIFRMGFRSGMFAGQSSTVISWSTNQLEVVLAVCSGAKVLLEKEISISIKLVSRWKHKVLHNLLVDGCIDCGLDKTQWTNTSRRHGTPNHHWLSETSHWTSSNLYSVSLHSSSRLWTLISKWNAKFTLIWKEDFGPLSNSPGIFLLIPGKTLLTMFLFQK